ASAKFYALELLYRDFRARHLRQSTPRAREFREFQQREAEWLRRQALFDALQEHFYENDRGVWGWPAWPAEYHDPDSAAVRRLCDERAERVEYFEYLQWQAAQQLERAMAGCRTLGLAAGLYLDIAVSVDRGGAEAWANQDCYALDSSIGAPPDAYNLKGQDWGLPAPKRRTRPELFAGTLRAAMRYAGIVRIDHVMGIVRLYCIPRGASPRDGAYVRYDVERMLTILASESQRSRCVVIGEDLGTLPAGFQELLGRSAVLSNRVLYFEREGDGEVRAPASYPRGALASVSTHDLPTLAGWWAARDLEWRERLALFPAEAQRTAQLAERVTDRTRLARALGIDAAGASAGALSLAAHEFVARSAAMIVAVQLEDALGVTEQANLPGTLHEHPNWRRKLPQTLEAMEHDARVDALAGVLARERPLAAGASRAQVHPCIPRATYRLQLHRGFTFDDAAAIAPYLEKLGVSHAYCSPVLRARAGSAHGYDVVSHGEINPELGGRERFERMAAALRAHGIGILLDVVPNHMCIGADNAWWLDVLEKGPASAYASYFDIDWEPIDPDLRGKVLLPVLGDHYGAVLERGELKVASNAAGALEVRYFDQRFPLDPRTYAATSPAELNSPERLHELLEKQAYRLAYWRVASDEINYRRFFDVTELAALRVEDEAVFEATHGLILDLAAAGLVDGLRIDHPDGLRDPERYFERLQEGYAKRTGAAHGSLYVVAEKIAARHEQLPRRWAVHGTTGYRFASVANGLFVDRSARGRIDRIWRAFTGERYEFDEAAYQGKRAVLRGALASELTALATRLLRIARADRRTRDFTFYTLRHALAEVAACFPVYRTYIVRKPSAQDQRYVEWAVARAARRSDAADASVFDFVRDALLGRTPPGASAQLAAQVLAFATSFQQFTAPVAAKGVEDTALYNYNRLVSLNEVGSDPDAFGLTVAAFHGASADRAKRWPHTIVASSTHDNKRSEDVRLRIDVLSEMPAAWRLLLRRWRTLNRSRRMLAHGKPAPSANDEYLLYQTLLGTFPVDAEGEEVARDYRERIERYMLKAAREAKANTSWINPNAEYESALTGFVRAALSPGPFLEDLRAQARPIAWFGALNSLSLALVKFTSPGVPDLYQGNELLDFSLVDPDNRREVDYGVRAKAIETLNASVATSDLSSAKLFVTWRLLDARRNHPELFRDGGYEPLRVTGARCEHAVAYARRHESRTLVVIAGRLFAKLLQRPHRLPLGNEAWGDTRIESEFASGAALTNLLTGETVQVTDGGIRIASAFATFPGAALLA
ncbi:MAG TPA: malto-oligosyltrehalose synthase, partial [Burkholderiales bacterium]|nr:malto-oligosyltrehalose synthase [Burkholderiales bacterium]